MFPAAGTISDNDEEFDDPQSKEENWLTSSTYLSKHDKQPVLLKSNVENVAILQYKPFEKLKSRKRTHKKEIPVTNVDLKRHKKIDNQKVFLEDIHNLKQKDAYLIDREPNKNIHKYKSIYEKQIPKFSSPLFNKIIGHESLIFFEFFPNVISDLRKKVIASRYFTKENRKMIKSKPLYIPSLQESDSHPDFMAFNRKQTDECHPDSSKVFRDFDVKMLNELLRNNSKDLKTWFQLFDSLIKDFYKNEAISFSDKGSRIIALSRVYSSAERALDLNPGSTRLKLFILAITEYAAELKARGFMTNANLDVSFNFTPENIEKEWGNMIFTFPQDVSIWRSYVSYLKSSGAHHGFQKIDAVYKRALSSLNGIITGRMLSHKPKQTTLLHSIDFFFEYCQWIKESGFKERALTYLRAFVEFNCFIPTELLTKAFLTKASASNSNTNKLNFEMIWSAFEDFWSSDTPKIGEPTAKGWSAFFAVPSAYAEDHLTENQTRVSSKLDESTCLYYNYFQLLDFIDDPQNEWKKSLMELVATSEAIEDSIMHLDFDSADSNLDSHLSAHVHPAFPDSLGAGLALRPSQDIHGLGQSRTRGLAWLALENSRDEVGLLSATALGLAPSQVEDPDRLVDFDQIRPLILEIALIDPKNFREADYLKALAIKRIILLFVAFLGVSEESISMLYCLPMDLISMQNLASVPSIERQQLLEMDVNSVYDSNVETTVNYQIARLKRRMVSNSLTLASNTLYTNDKTWQSSLQLLQFHIFTSRIQSAVLHGKVPRKNVFNVCKSFGRRALEKSPENLELWGYYINLLLRTGASFDAHQKSKTEDCLFLREAKSIFDRAGKLFPLVFHTESNLTEAESFWSDNFAPRLDFYKIRFKWLFCVDPQKPINPDRILTTKNFLRHMLGKSNRDGFIRQLQILAAAGFVAKNEGFSPLWLSKCASTLAYLHFIYQILIHDVQVLVSVVGELMCLLKKIDNSERSLGKVTRMFITESLAALTSYCQVKNRCRDPLINHFLSLIGSGAGISEPELIWPSDVSYLAPWKLSQSTLLELQTKHSIKNFDLNNFHISYPQCAALSIRNRLNSILDKTFQALSDTFMCECASTKANSSDTKRLLKDLLNSLGFEPDSPEQLDLFASIQPHAFNLWTLSLELHRWLSIQSLPTDTVNIFSLGAEKRVRKHFELIVGLSLRNYFNSFVHDWLLKHNSNDWHTMAHMRMIAVSLLPSKHAETLRIAVWRAYMAFEWMSISLRQVHDQITIEMARERRTRIKNVFYRAIDELPWAKTLYTDMVTYCPYDVQEIVELLLERQLRVRTPLEEVDLLLTANPY